MSSREATPARDDTRVIYALRIPGTHITKIGQSWRPDQRLIAFRRILRKGGIPCELVCTCVVGAWDYAFERVLHWHFRTYQG